MKPSYSAKDAVSVYNKKGDFVSGNFYYAQGDIPDTLAAVSCRGDVYTCYLRNTSEWVAERVLA